jgi:hypothetical protein
MGDAWTFSQMGLDLLRRIGIFQRSISRNHLNGISGQTDLLARDHSDSRLEMRSRFQVGCSESVPRGFGA